MIIIKMIILYSIQITHTDDFSSTGTRLVWVNLHVNTIAEVGSVDPILHLARAHTRVQL